MHEYFPLAVLATIIAGVIRTSVGVGAGIALTASLSLALDPRLTLAVMAFLQIGFGASAIGHYWRKWETSLAIRLIGWAVLGVILGTWLISVLPLDWTRRVLGAGLAVFAAIELIRREVLIGNGGFWESGAVAGVASGIAGSTANASGAVLAIHLKRLALGYDAFMGTLSLVVMGHDIVRLALYGTFGLLNREAFILAALLLPFVFVGGWIGTKVRSRVPELVLRRLVLSLVVVVGIMLLR